MTQKSVARVAPVSDTYFDVTITDPYRWMEDWKSDEAQAWIHGEAAFTRMFLDALPEHAAVLTRITELSDAAPRLSELKLASGRSFYLRRDAGEKVDKLVVRDTPDSAERVLIDPHTMFDTQHVSLDWYVPSWDGQRVAYGLSQGGSEASTLYVLEVENGTIHDFSISGTRLNGTDWRGLNGLHWLDDHYSFVYHRFPQRLAELPPAEQYYDSCTYLHQLGTDLERDSIILRTGINPTLPIARTDTPLLMVSPASSYVLALIVHGVLNEVSIYSASRTVLTHPTTTTWTKIVDIDDAVTGFAISGDLIYLRTHKDAPRYKVIATSVLHPDLATAPVIVPQGTGIIEDIQIVGDYLLIRELDSGLGRMRRVKLDTGLLEEVVLPFDGTFLQWASDPMCSEVVLHLTSWNISPRIYRYAIASATLVDTGWRPPSPLDFTEIEARRVYAPSKDGTLIPISIICKRGLALDGTNPTLLTGYGSYGFSFKPAFWPVMLTWYERGGIYAIAHIRGGGEYGREWHEAGQKCNKQNTIDDFIACAEYLIEQRYTNPERLASEGISAGGIPVANALVHRPDLWAAVIIRVGVTNTLRAEFSENGALNIPEFGSVSTLEGFKGLLLMDAYIKLQDGVAYPAVLFAAGANDPRVPIWHAMKMVARLQAATTSDKPVLLRVEFQAGHGIGSTQNQRDMEMADVLAFLIEQFRLEPT